MFEEIKQILNEYEDTINDIQRDPDSVTKEQERIVLYFEMHLAEAIIEHGGIDHKKLSRLIWANNNKILD